MTTILRVEDYENQLILYEQELSLDGYDVITAIDGKEALKKAQELSPDLIVMDINLPEMDGIESMLRILSTRENVG